MRRGAKPAKAKVEAKLPVARNSRKNEGSRVGDLEKRLAEALARETATSEILRVISSSPTDLQLVFDAIVQSIVRLCSGLFGTVFLYDGRVMTVAAVHNAPPEGLEALGRIFPCPPMPGMVAGRALLSRATVHVHDAVRDTDLPEMAAVARAIGFRTVIAVPMLREGQPIGALGVSRREVQPFSETEIELLKTFADQAVIAIENVRLFNETKEALEQQIATSEILSVISSSPTDLQPVFDAIARSTVRLCEAARSTVWRPEGDLFRAVARWEMTPEGHVVSAPRGEVLDADSLPSRAIRERQILRVNDVPENPTVPPKYRERARMRGYRSLMAVPMVREGRAVGVITVVRPVSVEFSDQQVGLVKTFADQAVIAIENVRLFNETKEALEQQTATAEVLRIISTSPTELLPVLEVVVKSAVRFCGADDATIFTLDRETLRAAAHHGPIPVGIGLPVPCVRGTVGGRSVLERRAVHVTDLQAEAEEFPEGSAFAKRLGHRTTLGVPLLREGAAVGTIQLRRAEVNPFTDKQIELLQTFADQAVIAIENVRLFNELEARNRALTETLEQQTATSEILRVISSSPTDVRPVFDTIVRSAVRLCGEGNGVVFQFDGELVNLAAYYNFTPEILELVHRLYPMRPSRQLLSGRVILSKAVVQVEDLLADSEYQHDIALTGGWRSALAVPMLREGSPVGVIIINRAETGTFSERQIDLLQTFADQAVIAIENVRLFKELEARNRALTEALEQQTATSEILRVISSSPTDIQPVLDAVTESAARLCDSYDAAVFRVDGEVLRLVAHRGSIPPVAPVGEETIPMERGTVNGRAVIERRPIQAADLPAAVAEYPVGSARAKAHGWRTQLSVPLLREGAAIGLIVLRRVEVRPFTDKQVALLQTFADQAVIAIENVRLFKELEARNRDLSATSEILQVISRSPTDVQPAFDTIADSAARLTGAAVATLYEYDGRLVHLRALSPTNYSHAAQFRTLFPRPLTPDYAAGRVILGRTALHVADWLTDPATPPVSRQWAEWAELRGVLWVPLLRDDEPVGVIGVARAEPGYFSDDHVKLLQTFADQAVIAIENVRLFTELQEKNRALTQAHAKVSEALEQQTATSEILRVISSSQTDVQPVFDTIVRSAVRLCDGLFCGLFQFDGELIHHVAHHNYTPEALEEMRRIFPARPTRALLPGRAILERAVVNIPDVLELDPEFRVQAVARTLGFRSGLWVPMLREGAPLGVISVTRADPGSFSDDQIGLLKTFADQAVIAIENVRLFKELEARNAELTESLDQQTATSEILRVISQSPTDVQPVFDTIVRNGMRLTGAVRCVLFGFDREMLSVLAMHNVRPEGIDMIHRIFPSPASRHSAMGRAVLDRTIAHIPDVTLDPQFSFPEAARAVDFRAVLAVPMIREDVVIGAIVAQRSEPGAFTESQVQLLKTFTDQAVIAIENVRLFAELREKNRALTESLERQTATSEILGVISSSPTDVQPVFDSLVASAARLCGANDLLLLIREGDVLRPAAGVGSFWESLAPDFRVPLVRSSVAARSVIDGATLHFPDLAALSEADFSVGRDLQRRFGHRTVLAVPLFREGSALGTIFAMRFEVRPFADQQIGLLKTFADQAVIAIENVRLFKELEEKNRAVTEALEQQTATAEILRVISSSPTHVQPVFAAIVTNARRLCEAPLGALLLYDGEALEAVELQGATSAVKEFLWGRRFQPGPPFFRPGGPWRPLHIDDIRDTVPYRQGDPIWVTNADVEGMRTFVAVPLVKDGQFLGSINVYRREVRRFSDKQIELLQTFAEQAVIAIENVRLFQELQARTVELTQSVEKLTALGEVGRAVSSTLDLETVLTTIVSRAVQLSGLDGGVVFEYDEGAEEFVQRVATDTGGALAEARRTTRIRKGEGVLGRTAITLEPVQVPDIAVPGAYEGRLRENLVESGIRAILAVPMVRENRLIGCLGVTRNRPGEFPAETTELLRTFATQSALAIQNARLFQEIEDKSRQLEAASQHKSEFLANMSHELRTPLNAVIGFSEVLAERMFGELNEKQEEYLKDIHASGQHLLSLINDILDLSKIEAGRMELELTDFNLPTTLDNALTLLRERAGRHGIALHMSVDERLNQIRADERKFRQVVLNLLSNAIKFTPEGGRIEVRAVPVDGSVEVSVSDTGVGIAPEDQEAVFEEFRQVGTAAKKVEGTGLGLALSRKFIELHGGKIWVKSQVGSGSTFTFTVPLRDAPSR